MDYRKLLSLLAALLLCFTGSALAEERQETVEYVGGVVYRMLPKDDPFAEYINVAYIRDDAAYTLVGETYEYQLVISGGVAPYEAQVTLYWQSLDAQSNSYSWLKEPRVDKDYRFSVSFDRHARFFFEVEIRDSRGQRVGFQMATFETYQPEAEKNPMTVAGKINQIVTEKITPGMSDYAKAKAMHDWLIFNANYDYNYEYYSEDGVLLWGRGVCDSYAKAYQRLMTAVGIECIRVSGTAGGGGHAWNMVKLDGQWYHVDCTWDDPGSGGGERWQYFCLTDEELAADHTWNRENTPDTGANGDVIAPETSDESIRQTEDTQTYEQTIRFTRVSEVRAWFDRLVAAGERPKSIAAWYIGPAERFDAVTDEYYDQWFWPMLRQYGVTSMNTYTWSDMHFSAELRWGSAANNYISILTSQLVLDAGKSEQIAVEYVYPEGSVITWRSADESVAVVSTDGRVTGVGEGETVVTASVASGDSKEIRIIVYGAHEVAFTPVATAAAGGVQLAWYSVPGVTEYRVMRAAGGRTAEVAKVERPEVFLSDAQLNHGELCEIYIVANRVVAGEVVISYTSGSIPWGVVKPSYQPSYRFYFPAAVTSIEADAFRDTAAGDVYLPDGLRTVGASAFANCRGMRCVRVPSSVTAIGAGAFSGVEYAVVTEGSMAHSWFKTNMPNVQLIFE